MEHPLAGAADGSVPASAPRPEPHSEPAVIDGLSTVAEQLARLELLDLQDHVQLFTDLHQQLTTVLAVTAGSPDPAPAAAAQVASPGRAPAEHPPAGADRRPGPGSR